MKEKEENKKTVRNEIENGNKIEDKRPPFLLIDKRVLSLGLSATQLATYVALISFADNTSGECYPRRSTIAKTAGISIKSVDRAIKKLQAVSLIKVTPNVDEITNEKFANTYAILPLGGRDTVTQGRDIMTQGEDTESQGVGTQSRIELESYRTRPKEVVVEAPESVESKTEPALEPVTEKTSTTTTTETSSGKLQAIIRAYESNIGIITPAVVEGNVGNGNMGMTEALEEYPQDWLVEAIEVAAVRNKRSWGYALGVLKRWKAEGRDQRGSQPREPHKTKLIRRAIPDPDDDNGVIIIEELAS